MHTNRKKVLFYSFFLFFIMACRTWGCSRPQNVLTAEGPAVAGNFKCQSFIQLAADSPTEGFVCTLVCPTGVHTFDLYDKEINEFVTMTLPQVQAQYCPGGAPSSNSTVPTEEPTQEPTEEPASTEAPTDPAPLKPYLTGTFTTCDNEARYVNFTIADPAAPFDPATHKVLFNGVEATCTRAASAFDVLTCIYPPAPNGPPAGIQVFIGEELVNEFDFNGGKICDPAPQPNTDTEATEEPNNPAPAEPPATEPAPTEDTGGDG